MTRLFLADLKMIFRNRQALFWALAFPIMFATIFGLFRFDQLPDVSVRVHAVSQEDFAKIASGLTRVESIKVCDVGGTVCDGARPRTEDDVRRLVENGDADYGLIVRRDGMVTVVAPGSTADSNRIYIPVFERVLDKLNIAIANIQPHYVATTETVAGESRDYYDFVLPGLVGMAVMTYGIIGLGGTIAQWRGQKILRRIRATPLRPGTFLAAVVLAHLVLALVQSALVLAWGVFVFGGTVAGNLLWIAVFVMLGNLTFLNIGFMVATRAQSAEAASGVGNAVSMPMMFFSGVFFPTSTLPWILPALTAILPLHPLVDAIRRITIEGASITDLGSQLWKLAAWAGVTFILARRVFRFEKV
jgi:ABC-2 type transport system permease protein